MTYGLKRWAMGCGFGYNVAAACALASVNSSLWAICAGAAIVFFFADCRINPEGER